MKTYQILVYLMLTAAFAGCATNKTVDDFINDKSTKKGQIDSAMNYQKAYRIVADQTRKCLQQGSVGNENVSSEKLDPDIKMGVVTLTGHNAILGQNVMAHFIVEPGSKKDTAKIMVYAPGGMLNQYGSVEKSLRFWLSGATSCNIPSDQPTQKKGP